MNEKRWALNAYSQWGDARYVNFDAVAVRFERLARHERFGPGHFTVAVVVFGFGLTVTRYGA